VMLTGAVLISAGNTLLPVLLRCALHVLHLALRRRGGGATCDAVALLLERPRLWTTYMFEFGQTWWLLLIWLLTTVLQWLIYSVVPLMVETQPSAGRKVLEMFFTTIATRTAGFNVINLNTLQAGVLVLQLLLMYLSSYSFIVAVQSSRETEAELERPEAEASGDGSLGGSQRAFVSQIRSPALEARKVLSDDLTWLAVGCWLIAIANPSLDVATLFRLIWEIVSAYGTVGTSLSLPTDVASFSGGLNAFGKMVIVAIMIAGRHRGMPHSLDAATASVRPPVPIGNIETQDNLVHRLEHLADSRLRKRRITRMDGSRLIGIESNTEETFVVVKPGPARPHVANVFRLGSGRGLSSTPTRAAQAARPAGPLGIV
jgi:hypothetical protein